MQLFLPSPLKLKNWNPMNHSPLSVDRSHPGITLLTLNRPEKRNALNLELMELLCQAITESQSLPDQRALIITGAGPLFCSGMDLKESLLPDYVEPLAKMIARLLTTLYSSPLVTIAAVHGAAIAGGAGVMSACDFAIAATGTKIGYPEVHRGLVAAQVATLLRRQLQERQVRELLLLGELIEAERALAIGLINSITSIERLLPDALLLARRAQQGAPVAIAETKRLIAALAQKSLDDDLAIAIDFHHRARLSSESQEGITAFLQKRTPSWTS
jgi:methylglutaconyl-CoA hydratase